MRLPLRLRLLDASRRMLGGSAAGCSPGEVADHRARAHRVQAGTLGRAVLGRRPRDVVVEETTVVTDAAPGGLAVRVYRPPSTVDTPPPVVINFHGGGFVQGNLDQSDWFCGHVARAGGVVVLSVDYRLAPEHPYPAGPTDAYEVTAAVAADPGTWGVDADRLFTMGDSAGGCLAAVVALMARDRGGPRVAGQVLVYPGVELLDVLPSERALPRAPLLSAADIRGYSRLYLGVEGDGTESYASPLRADHTALPPALIQTAEHDPLRDHGERYAVALRAAGVEVRHTRYLGAAHGYICTAGLTPGVSHQSVWEVAAFLRGPGR